MSRLAKRLASQAVKSGPSRRGVPLPRFVRPQLSRPVDNPPSGPQWLHEIKLDGYRMAARIDDGRGQLLISNRARLDRQISERHRSARKSEREGERAERRAVPTDFQAFRLDTSCRLRGLQVALVRTSSALL